MGVNILENRRALPFLVSAKDAAPGGLLLEECLHQALLAIVLEYVLLHRHRAGVLSSITVCT